MSLVMAELPLPVAVLAYVAIAAVVAGFVTLGVAIVGAALRRGVSPARAEDNGLPFFEQAYKQQQREGLFLLDKRFRTERRLMGFGLVGIVVGMATMLLLTVLFGK